MQPTLTSLARQLCMDACVECHAWRQQSHVPVQCCVYFRRLDVPLSGQWHVHVGMLWAMALQAEMSEDEGHSGSDSDADDDAEGVLVRACYHTDCL